MSGNREQLERYADSLYGELEAEKHAHRKDNEYLLAENERLREALEVIATLITTQEWVSDDDARMLVFAREALAAR